MNNQAFIDGCNINLVRFRVYLKEKYDVDKAYYFLGAVSDENTDLYNSL